MAQKTYENNGVFLSKKKLYSGDKVILKYDGLLSQAGAEDIYVHVGFGESWDDRYFVTMTKENSSFMAEIDIKDGKSCGICFKDAADNWDNNSGENYVFTISQKTVRKKSMTKRPKKQNKALKL